MDFDVHVRVSTETIGFDGFDDKWIQDSEWYCAISINSAGPVTRDSPAEILVSARHQIGRDSKFFRHIGKIFEAFCGIYSHPPLNDTPPLFDTLLYTL